MQLEEKENIVEVLYKTENQALFQLGRYTKKKLSCFMFAIKHLNLAEKLLRVETPRHVPHALCHFSIVAIQC